MVFFPGVDAWIMLRAEPATPVNPVTLLIVGEVIAQCSFQFCGSKVFAKTSRHAVGRTYGVSVQGEREREREREKEMI
jgi:hypothetical protein